MTRDAEVTIYHNPNCGTSRNTLAKIREAGIEPKVVEYLKEGWTKPQLKEILKKLGQSPRDILRLRGNEAHEHIIKNPNSTDDEILDWVRRDGETALHPSCTARMGVDDMSVTDPLTMGVHGIDGLKVVDASAMPYVTNGNIYAPVMMLAEKAADLILGNTPLAAEPVDFYRHENAR